MKAIYRKPAVSWPPHPVFGVRCSEIYLNMQSFLSVSVLCLHSYTYMLLSHCQHRYFADEYRKSSLYWASLCELMSNNAGSTQQVGAVSWPFRNDQEASTGLLLPIKMSHHLPPIPRLEKERTTNPSISLGNAVISCVHLVRPRAISMRNVPHDEENMRRFRFCFFRRCHTLGIFDPDLFSKAD